MLIGEASESGIFGSKGVHIFKAFDIACQSSFQKDHTKFVCCQQEMAFPSSSYQVQIRLIIKKPKASPISLWILSHCFTLNLFSYWLKCIFLSYAFSHFYFFLPYNSLISFAHFSIGFRVDFLTVDSSLQIPHLKGHEVHMVEMRKWGGGMCEKRDRYPEFAARMGCWDF